MRSPSHRIREFIPDESNKKSIVDNCASWDWMSPFFPPSFIIALKVMSIVTLYSTATVKLEAALWLHERFCAPF